MSNKVVMRNNWSNHNSIYSTNHSENIGSNDGAICSPSVPQAENTLRTDYVFQLFLFVPNFKQYIR